MIRQDMDCSVSTLLSYEANRKIRKGWGEIRPTLRVIEDKRRAKRDKIDRKEMRNYAYDC